MLFLFWLGHLLSYFLARKLHRKSYSIEKHEALFKKSKIVTIAFLLCIVINFLLLKPQNISLIGTYTDWTLNLIFCFFADLFFIVFSAYYYQQAETIRILKKVDAPIIYRWARKVYMISIIVRLVLIIPLAYMASILGLHYFVITYPKEDGIISRTSDILLFNDIYINQTRLNSELSIYVRRMYIFKKQVLKTTYRISAVSLDKCYIKHVDADSILIGEENIEIRKTDNGYNISGMNFLDSFSIKNIK